MPQKYRQSCDNRKDIYIERCLYDGVNMAEDVKRVMKNNFFLSFILMGLGVAILLVQTFGIPHLIMVPSIIFILTGFWIVFLGIDVYKNPDNNLSFGPTQSTYFITWGSLFVVMGITLIIYWFRPKANIEGLIGLFLIVLGLLIISINYTLLRNVEHDGGKNA